MVTLPILNSSQWYEVRPTKIICLGLNYRDHVAEHTKIGAPGFTDQIPSEPVVFPKTPNTLIGPEQSIILPKFVHDSGFDKVETHYEAELALFVADHCKNVRPEDAYAHIQGFTCANDVSQRNIQRSDKSGWFRGKSLDTFCPVGPILVPMNEIGDPQNLAIECRLNGKQVQKSTTANMIFSIAEILSFVSTSFTLEAGDLILTGTPGGVGEIRHGDVVEIEIERIGVLKNPVVDERFMQSSPRHS